VRKRLPVVSAQPKRKRKSAPAKKTKKGGVVKKRGRKVVGFRSVGQGNVDLGKRPGGKKNWGIMPEMKGRGFAEQENEHH